MAQNPEKYFYINRVGLVRGSWGHKKFEEDARLHHMEEQPGKLVALRLTEYYELIERLEKLGGAWTIPGAPLPEANGVARANGAVKANGATAKTVKLESLSSDQEEQREQEEQDPDQIIDDSIDYWTNL